MPAAVTSADAGVTAPTSTTPTTATVGGITRAGYQKDSQDPSQNE
jgi:hypothetical protein